MAEDNRFENTELVNTLHDFIAGVDYENNSSVLGDNILLNLRGKRSFQSGNDPLIVLNGVPFYGSLYDIDPHDIETITVLKDVTSSAIYGSRGRNGVIQIKTRKPVSAFSKPSKLSYKGTVGVNTVFSPYPMMNGQQYAELRDLLGVPVEVNDEHRGVSTDWQDLFYQTGLRQSHDLGTDFGWKSGGVHVGLCYMKQEGVVPTQFFERLHANVSITQQIGQSIRLTFQSNNTSNTQQGGAIDLYPILYITPLIRPYDQSGELIDQAQGVGVTYQLASLQEEHLSKANVQNRNSSGSYNLLSAQWTCPWIEGLSYQVNYGFNYRDYHKYNIDIYEDASLGDDHLTGYTESLNDVRYTRRTHLLDQQVNYHKTFDNEYSISAVLDYIIENDHSKHKSYYQSQFFSGTGAQGGPSISMQESKTDSKWLSQVYRVSVNGKGLWSVDAAVRRDMLIEAAVSPTVTARLAGLSQWIDAPWLDALTPSVSWGQVKSLSIDAIGEKVKSWNYAIDFSAFNERLTANLCFYNQKASNLLTSISLPYPMSSVWSQDGAMENRGFEFRANARILQQGDWRWNLGLNLWHNTNKITEITKSYGDVDINSNNGFYVGHSVNAVCDYQYEGLWNTDDPDWKYIDILQPGYTPAELEGTIKVKYTGERDASGKPLRSIGVEDRQVFSLDPKLQGSFNTLLKWRDLDLSVVAYFQMGGKLISNLHGASSFLNSLDGERGQLDVDYWTPNNKGARYPNPKGAHLGGNPLYCSSLSYFDASQLRISDITLGYDIFKRGTCHHDGPRPKIGLLRVYATVQNPFVLFSPYHKETGLMPQTNSMSYQSSTYSSRSYANTLPVVSANAPFMRSWLLGVNIEL